MYWDIMNLKKSTIAIIFCLFWTQSIFAARWAVIQSDKAIVYADKEMSSEIGYIPKGKKIRVGEVSRNRGRVLPIVISNKIAYVKISDIQESEKLEDLQNSSVRIKKVKNNEKSDNRISLYGGSMLGNVSFSDSPTEEENYNLLFVGGGIRGYRSTLAQRTGFRSGLERFVGEKDDERFSMVSFQLDYYFKIFKSDFYDFQAFAGGNIIPFAEYKLGSLFNLNGQGAGGQAGLEMIFKLSSYAVHVEGSYHYIKLLNFKVPENDDGIPESINPVISAAKLSAAISFAF